MSGIFFVGVIVMAVIAFAFIGLPLINRNRRNLVLAVSIALPVCAAALYWSLGTPQLVEKSLPANDSMQVAGQNPASGDSKSVGSVASMVDGLAARLAENPDDSKNWLLLAKSYKHLNRIPEAIEAYEKATALGETDAELAALAITSDSGELSTAQVIGNLSLSDKATDIIEPTDTVFIFARAVNGPKMPVAVLRRAAADLPIDFLLSDDQSMTPDVKLSNYDEVIVTAKISRSGVATEALKGLEAQPQTVRVADAQHVTLVIE